VYSHTTLETVQALFLLSTVAQNALRPHDCYMYLGMALRSAVAIGMHQESSRVADQHGRRRTWWAIYNLELELCCASGRPDGLPRQEHIMVDLPHLQEELPEVSMINVMVEYGRIARQVLGMIYLQRRTLQEKLGSAREFDAALCNWRESLATTLYCGPQLEQPDYVERQSSIPFHIGSVRLLVEIVLELRFHHLRLLIHQPVLIIPLERSELYRWHIDNCLSSASSTVHHLHRAFKERQWFRSWWYNSTYCLFACMVLLYSILRKPLHQSIATVCHDVEMGLEVLQAMGSHRVVKRCYELVSEVYELAKKVIQDQPAPNQTGMSTNLEEDPIFPTLVDPFLLEEFAFYSEATPGIHPPPWNAEMEVEDEETNSTLETFLSFMASRTGSV
jgi:Fungal specific transcription factor domain